MERASLRGSRAAGRPPSAPKRAALSSGLDERKDAGCLANLKMCRRPLRGATQVKTGLGRANPSREGITGLLRIPWRPVAGMTHLARGQKVSAAYQTASEIANRHCPQDCQVLYDVDSSHLKRTTNQAGRHQIIIHSSHPPPNLLKQATAPGTLAAASARQIRQCPPRRVCP